MDVIGIIPARYRSKRFEGKVLADILGKPMIQYVWEEASKATLLDDLIVACDDERIESCVKGFGGKALLTSEKHRTGADRIAEIIYPLDVRIVINIQADEPLIRSSMIDDLARCLLDDSNLVMATLIKRIEDKDEIFSKNVVKVVIDKYGFALYFSRLPIPHCRDKEELETSVYFKHIGIYGYTKDFLFVYKNLPEGNLEKKEKLEQLRTLEAGYKIKCIETKFDTVGVDTRKDLEKVKEILKKR